MASLRGRGQKGWGPFFVQIEEQACSRRIHSNFWNWLISRCFIWWYFIVVSGYWLIRERRGQKGWEPIRAQTEEQAALDKSTLIFGIDLSQGASSDKAGWQGGEKRRKEVGSLISGEGHRWGWSMVSDLRMVKVKAVSSLWSVIWGRSKRRMVKVKFDFRRRP